MSKIITTFSLRSGVGRSTIACLLGTALARKGYKTLIIDNNYKFCDISNYLLVNAEYGVDTIIPFIRSGVIEKSTLKSVLVNVEKDLDILAGSKIMSTDNTLKADDLNKIKCLLDSEYDYIIIDAKQGIESDELYKIAEITEIPLVISQNKSDKEHFNNFKKSIDCKNLKILNDTLVKGYIIYNKVEGSDFKKGLSFQKDRIFKLNYSSKLLDFCNGFTADIFSDNEDEVGKIISCILKKEIKVSSKGFQPINIIKSTLKKLNLG